MLYRYVVNKMFIVFKYEKKLHTPAGALNFLLPSLQFALLADLLLVTVITPQKNGKGRLRAPAGVCSQFLLRPSLIVSENVTSLFASLSGKILAAVYINFSQSNW